MHPTLTYDEDDDEEDFVPSTLPNTPQPSPQLPPRRSSRIPIPTECNPGGSLATTRTEAAVQASQMSGEHIREQQKERREAKQTTEGHPEESVAGNDVINDLHQTFNNLDLGDQAHELLALILEMNDLDPESPQFGDEPKTWDEAKNSADAA